MTVVFTILVLMIAVTPLLTIIGGLFSEGFIMAIAATAIALLALTLHESEFRRLAALLKPTVLILLIPCIWMLIQIMPMPGDSLPHPAWASASIALGRPLVGAISLDIGATMLCVARYSLVLAVAIIAAAVALDRKRAEIILYLLTTVTALTAAGLIATNSGYLRIGLDLSSIQRAQILSISVMGIILSCATAMHAYENHGMQRGRLGESNSRSIYVVVLSIASITICLLPIIIDGDVGSLLSAACGVSILIIVAAIRRLRLGPWGQSGIAAVALVGLIGFFAANPANKDLELTLSSQPRTSIATAERMLSDTKWIGTGAGTFEALFPIYRDADDIVSHTAPTAAAAIAIEMGRPFLWGSVILALISAWILFRRAMMRGRDYFYAGAGAGCIIAVLVMSFASVGPFGLAASLLTSVIFGLALAQSKSGSTYDPKLQ